MEQRFDGGLGAVQQGGDLAGRQVAQKAVDEDVALVRRQGSDGGADKLLHFMALDDFLWGRRAVRQVRIQQGAHPGDDRRVQRDDTRRRALPMAIHDEVQGDPVQPGIE